MEPMRSGGGMKRNRVAIALLVMVALLMAACGTDDPAVDETLDTEVPPPASESLAIPETDEEGIMIDEDEVMIDEEGISDLGEPHDVDVESLTAGTWLLRFGGGPSGLFESVEGSAINITFKADGTFTGNTGCNNYGGTYVVDGPDGFLGEEIFADEEGCTGAVGDAEAAYLEALRDVTEIVVFGGDQLVLAGFSTELVFVPAF